MLKGLLGKKIGMTQIFDEDGTAVPITLIEAGPCYVTQVRHPKKNGYSAVQLGFQEVKSKHLTGGQLGHLKSAGTPQLRYLREFRAKDHVDVVGTSKGRGFAGVVKRYGFSGGPRTHGQSDRLRAVGSIGATSTPGRVFKGKRMPGRMGGRRVTAQNLKVVLVDAERNLLGVRGAVPGAKGRLVVIKEARKN
jgi:large subunit ribosomal protein L3